MDLIDSEIGVKIQNFFLSILQDAYHSIASWCNHPVKNRES